MKKIIREQSTRNYSGLPYVFTLFHNLLSTWSGLMFLSRKNEIVTTISALGALLECVYVLVFMRFVPEEQKLTIKLLLVALVSIFVVVASISVYVTDDETRTNICGYVSCVSSIIMYGSPLFNVWHVIQSKSVETLPFFPSFFALLCSISWSIYGLLGEDIFITVPSIIGCGLAAVQLLVHFIVE